MKIVKELTYYLDNIFLHFLFFIGWFLPTNPAMNTEQRHYKNLENTMKEYSLSGRHKLIYDWLSSSLTLLDAGCSSGYATRYYQKKTNKAIGIDTDELAIQEAKRRYSGLTFKVMSIENTEFVNKYFDVVIMSDVLEHLKNDLIGINEVYRILKKGGSMIITVPHKGLFGFLDTDNIIGHRIFGRPWHRHYNIEDIKRLLNKSAWNSKYKIKRVYRSGLITGIIAGFLSAIGIKSEWLANLDYNINFGKFSYNLAVEVIKNENSHTA